MTFHIIIPARYASTRLPGKPLVDLAGKSMIERVYDRACLSGAESVVIATDDQRIADEAYNFADLVTLTSAGHQSGTDRMAEVAERMNWADDVIVVNVQGDEPMIPPAVIDQVAEAFQQHPDADIATLCTALDEKDMGNPNAVKVVRDEHDFALYFSRAPIPWDRDTGKGAAAAGYRHLGIYGYRVGALKRFAATPSASLELLEGLEQLRALSIGMRIHCATACEVPGPGVDTEADAERVRALLK